MADPAPGISAIAHEDNLRYFNVAITGPEGSPFERMSSATIFTRSRKRAVRQFYFILFCAFFFYTISPTRLVSDFVYRRSVQVGAFSTRRVPHEPTQSTIPHEDIPSEHW
jgi:hypothetical protein